MKYVVDGREVETKRDDSVELNRLPDRLMVRTPGGTRSALAVRKGDAVYVSYLGRTYLFEKARRIRHAAGADSSGEARAPMPGQIVEILIAEGELVVTGDRLLILEAMKMQQAIVAPSDGAVEQLLVERGDQVEEGQVLAIVGPGVGESE